MARKKSTTSTTKARTKDVAATGTAVRDRVRELSVGAFRDRKFSMDGLSKLVHEVLDGAVGGVDASIPRSDRSVLREVFNGLSEGVRAVAAAGSSVAGGVRERGEAIADKSATAAKRMRGANEEFLSAVKSFAGKASKEVREELDALVAQARRTGPEVAGAARKAAKAADGRLLELSGETARAGMDMVRRAAGTVAMGVSGLLQGVAEVVKPKERAAAPKPAKVAPKRSAAKKKTAKKKTARQKPAR